MESDEKICHLLNKIYGFDGESENDIFLVLSDLSKILEESSGDDLDRISSNNTLYIDPIFNIINSNIFINNLVSIISNPNYNTENKNKYKKEKKIIRILLCCSFFVTSSILLSLKKESLVFISRHFGNSIKHLHINLQKKGIDIKIENLLLLLESISSGYKFNTRKSEKIVDYDSIFFKKNRILSRTLFDFMLINFLLTKRIPKLLNLVKNNELNTRKFFQYTHVIFSKQEYYKKNGILFKDNFTENERKVVRNIYSFLENSNLNNLIYLSSLLFLDTGKDGLDGTILNLINTSTLKKKQIQEKFEKLISKLDTHESDSPREWSNKIFINTIRFFSTLESISSSQNDKWKINVFWIFYNIWIEETDEIVNLYGSTDQEKISIFVEGPSDQIILENAFKILFPFKNNLFFHAAGGCKEIYTKLNAVNIEEYENTVLGIYDFDSAFGDFNGLSKARFSEMKGDIHSGYYRERIQETTKMYALLLPVPEFRSKLASLDFKTNSLLSIEMLFEDSLLESHGYLKQEYLPGGAHVKLFKCSGGKSKIDFAHLTKNFERDDFKHFAPLFDKIFELVSP